MHLKSFPGQGHLSMSTAKFNVKTGKIKHLVSALSTCISKLSSVTTSKISSIIRQQKLSSSLEKSDQSAEKAPSQPKTRVQFATDLP